jgi:hypothetical protein
MSHTTTQQFALGQLLATPAALEALTSDDLLIIIQRHAVGDWGELCEEDIAANQRALLDGSRILSGYTVAGERLWVITEADRSATTVLLPEEY